MRQKEQECLTNAQNLFDFMEEEREPDNWYKNVDFTRHNNGDAGKFIDISDIEFNYSDDKEILTGYSLSSKKGETIAITGPSGCGKSTLSKLLLSLYPIKGGNISIGGRSYYDLSNEEIRKMIAYVPQEPYLFNMSVRENILIGKPDATDEEIIDAAKRANAHDFIINLEEGYDTNVGERGNRLSGGQRQRIAIARAIIKDAPVILLDEATSALDNESEQMVNDAMKNMKKDRNIIMIAHRPSTIALADRVCPMGE